MTDESGAPVELDRRRLLASFFWAATSFVGVALLAPLVGYFLGPLRGRAGRRPLPVARLADLPRDVPQRVELALRRRDGWVTEEGRLTAWVVRRNEGVLVFDPRCTHLGCAYHWHTQTNQFLCPCHNGLYDIEGRVTGGPPPRPLDVFPTHIEDGVVYVVPTPQRRA
jgi:menaquinol-cytochrome c reductase iron-sulfur subunit